jgi:hypothetical protein
MESPINVGDHTALIICLCILTDPEATPRRTIQACECESRSSMQDIIPCLTMTWGIFVDVPDLPLYAGQPKSANTCR